MDQSRDGDGPPQYSAAQADWFVEPAEHRRMVGVAALGLGVHVAAPTVFAAPPAWEHRNSPSTGLYSVPRAGGHGLVKQAVLDG
ncbi:hypothetical protein OG216_13030 [Streptomycetaceae bacterium NBC_01309]